MNHETFTNPNIYEQEFEEIINQRGLDICNDSPLDFRVDGRHFEVKGLTSGNTRILISDVQLDTILNLRGYVVIINKNNNLIRVIDSHRLNRLINSPSTRSYLHYRDMKYHVLNVRWLFHSFKSLNTYLTRWKNGT